MQSTINHEEINMLRSEVELLMKERHALLKVTGAAAGLIGNAGLGAGVLLERRR